MKHMRGVFLFSPCSYVYLHDSILYMFMHLAYILVCRVEDALSSFLWHLLDNTTWNQKLNNVTLHSFIFSNACDRPGYKSDIMGDIKLNHSAYSRLFHWTLHSKCQICLWCLWAFLLWQCFSFSSEMLLQLKNTDASLSEQTGAVVVRDRGRLKLGVFVR